MQEIPNSEPEKMTLSPEDLKRIEAGVKRAEKMATLLDQKMLDPIIGLLIPEGGDAITAFAGLYIIYEAKKADVPAMELAKMLGRTGVDFLSGAVPIVGDLFDFVYKSNTANAESLRKHFENISTGAEDPLLQEGELIAKDRAELREDIEGKRAA